MASFSLLELLWLSFTLLCLIIIGVGLSRVSGKVDWHALKRRNFLLRYASFILIWILALYLWAKNGFFANTNSFPPRVIIAILIPTIAILVFSFSNAGVQLIKAVSPHTLILMQSFRIVVEMLIWYTYIESKLPLQMTFEGKNLDILSGILALPVGYYIWKYKNHASGLILVYNFIGIALLLNILIVAMLSLPTPFRYFTNEPSNIIISSFPYILLPGVLVPIAIAMHIFSLRKRVLGIHAVSN